MEKVLVAKSYLNCEQIGEIFSIQGKNYIQVRLKNGNLKSVRVYSQKEYSKYYPDLVENNKKSFSGYKSQKDVLGFEKGFITIFKGNTYPYKDWFKENGAVFRRCWGWSFGSTQEVPIELPFGVEAVRLSWESVGADAENLKPDEMVEAAVQKALYGEKSSGEYIGNVGDRIEVYLTVKRAVALDGYYGRSTMHVMEDVDGNTYVWTTASRSWEEGSEHMVRGTIKDHKEYKGICQNVLTRCKDLNKEN